MKVARIYMRVSTDAQELERQEQMIDAAKITGFYVAGVYKEKASGARHDRKELQRMITDLQSGETLIAERMDRISRLPLPEAERLVGSIRTKGVRLAIPGLVDFADLVKETDSEISKIVLQAVQDMLLRISLQMAREDYELRRERQRQGIEIAKRERRYTGRKPDKKKHELIMALRVAGHTIAETAKMAGCSPAQVKVVQRLYREQGEDEAKKEISAVPVPNKT